MSGAPDRLTWIGHSTVLLDLGGVRLLTDPVLRGRLGHLRRHGAAPAPGVTERVDVLLISHQHLDHLDVPSLRRLARDVEVLAPAGVGERLRGLGFSRVSELVAGDTHEVRGVRVTAVPARHDSRRHRFASPAVALGFVVGGPQTVYFAGDTDLFDEMSRLAENLDVALLPVWGWGPSLGTGHMDPLTAARAAALLRPRIAVPIHWGTLFPIGLDLVRGAALVEPPRVFARHAARLAPDVDVKILRPGSDAQARNGSSRAPPVAPGEVTRDHPAWVRQWHRDEVAHDAS